MSLTIFGTIADSFDSQVDRAIQDLDWWVEQSGYSTDHMIAASVLQAFMRFSQGFVDVLRLGEGVSEGTLSGVGQDVLRLLVVAGPLIRLGAAGVRLLRVGEIAQSEGTYTCTWVAAIQATRRAGYAYLIRLLTLFEKAEVSEGAIAVEQGTSVINYVRLVGALRQLGIRVIEHSINSIDNMIAIARSRPNSVFVLSVEYGETGEALTRPAHTLHAAVVRGSVHFFDTTGTVYRNLAELRAAYPNATLLPAQSYPTLEIPNSVIVVLEQQAPGISALPQQSANATEIFLQVIPPTQVRGLPGYGYTADGRRVGNWPENEGLNGPPRTTGRRGLHGYGCLANNQPYGRWPDGVTPECD